MGPHNSNVLDSTLGFPYLRKLRFEVRVLRRFGCRIWVLGFGVYRALGLGFGARCLRTTPASGLKSVTTSARTNIKN